MLSESARVTSASEARFRVQAPNSVPRVVKIVALDPASADVVCRLARGSWHQAAFFSADAFIANLEHEVADADLVVMVAGAGASAEGAAVIGRACSDRRVTTTALIIGAHTAPDEALSRTLARLRPWSLMVVIANADDYIEDMLIALRA